MPQLPDFECIDLIALALIPQKDWPADLVHAHWVWTGGKTEDGHPIMRSGDEVMTVRRVMHTLYADEPRSREAVFFRVECGHKQCVNPTHFSAPEYKDIPPTAVQVPVEAQAEHSENDMQDLADQLQCEWAAKQPTSLDELCSRPIVCEFTREQVIFALKLAELPVLA